MWAASLAMNLKAGHDPELASAAGHVLEAIGHPPAGQSAKPFERQRGTGTVADQSLAPHVVAAFDVHARVQVEPVALDGDRWLAGCPLVVVILGGLGVWQRRHLAATHGDRGARIEGGLHGRFVGALGERSFVQVAVAAKPGLRTVLHAPHDRVQLLACGNRSRMEDRARVHIAAEDAIETGRERDKGAHANECREWLRVHLLDRRVQGRRRQIHDPDRDIELDEADGWIHFVNVCDRSRDKVVVVNTAAHKTSP